MLEENSIFAARYQIVRRLASGGMGAVYEARHVETGRACALKVMLAHVAENSSSRERFRLEARAAALVSSAHVVEVLDAGVHDATGSPFLVMELLRGEDLASRMSRLGPLPVADVAKFIFQAARGLDALHRAAIVHRDLKPSNLFLAKRDDSEIIKVLDLGVAKRVMDTAVTTAVVGTPLYMAPEQMANRKISPATDEYALAMVAYSLLVGREYWAAEAETATSSIGFALLALDGPKDAATERANKVGVSLPAAFDTWFRRATAKEPEARFPDVMTAAIELCTALGIDASVWRKDADHGGQINEEQAPKNLPLDVFAPTPVNEKAEKTHLKTMTLGEELPEAKAQTMGLATTEADPKLEKRKRRKRLFGGIAGIGLLGAIALGFLSFRDRNRNEIVAPVPIVSALQCPAAEITGPGKSPHLADALAKGACARLGVELGVSWLDPKGTPLTIQAETREDRSAHVVLQIAEQKAQGEGKTLMKATNNALGKLAPLLKVAPMDPQRIADWGAKDAASALRIEKAMRQKAFGFADRVEIGKRIVETDGDSPVSHAMLACAVKYTDREVAIREKKEALDRLSKLPPKRAQIVQASLMNFIPTPDDPKESPSIVDSYTEIGKDPDFATLYTMCGCVLTGVTFPMADWLSKNAPIMGLPILPCAMGGDDVYHSHDPAERYMMWMKTKLPEWQSNYVETLVRLGWSTEAREATELLEWLDTESTNSPDIVTSKMLLAFGAFESKKAISITEASFGEPDAETADERAIEYVNSLIFAGKMRNALEVGEQRIYFLWRAGKNELLVDFAAEHLRLRRLLNRPALPAITLERIEQAREKLPISARDQLDVELALLRARENKDKKSKDSLEALLITINESDMLESYKHADAFRILRHSRKNEAALASYREISQLSVHRSVSFEGGLAFEAIGDKTGAEISYLLAVEQPWNHPFDAVAARIRLAEILRADGRADEAYPRLVEVDRAWAEADSDLRDIVKRMK